ncbi:MAG: hypothetical protein EOO55_03465 [Hymenobacter sp.]|nr:MAG: hypothetical protein EOO55_03465 [Hymenobacter sp.]
MSFWRTHWFDVGAGLALLLGTWLYLHRDAFERLAAYKRHHGLATWEQTIERLIPDLEAEELACE